MKFRVLSLVALLGFVVSAEAAKKVYCHSLSVLVNLGDKPGCYKGHAGIVLDEEYFDWGPSDDSRSDFLYYLIGDKGEPYADTRLNSNKKRKTLAKAQDIRRYLKSADNNCSAYEARVRITQQEAFLVRYYWDFIYSSAPYFHVLKNQCTNIAFSSLKYAGLLEGRVVLFPKSLLAKSQKELISTCGENRGKAAEIIRIK